MSIAPSAISSVARIAYLSSDVLVDILPSIPKTSDFADVFSLLSKNSAHRPTRVSLPAGADAGSAILRYPSATLLTFISPSNLKVVTELISSLPTISSRPTVLHFAIKGDLSDVLLLRAAVPFFVLSSTAQEAHDNALLASRLAIVEMKAVVHAFYVGDAEELVEEIEEEAVQPFLKNEASHITAEESSSSNTATSADLDVGEPFKSYARVAKALQSILPRVIEPTSEVKTGETHTIIFTVGRFTFTKSVEGVSFIRFSLVKPLVPELLSKSIPSSISRVIILEAVPRWAMKWAPIYLEIARALQDREPTSHPPVFGGILGDCSELTPLDVLDLIQRASTAAAPQILLGKPYSDEHLSNLETPYVPKQELSYTKVLSHLFGDRLEISNSPSLVLSQGDIATTPEFALGRVRGQFEHRADLISAVQELIEFGTIEAELHELLTGWVLSRDDPFKSRDLGVRIVDILETRDIPHVAVERILDLKEAFPARSKWIIGSDAWSYDIGSSGLHHAIASGLDINVLILDTHPYSSRNLADPNRRKQDAGLYAMNHGDVYVASVAVYSSYSQVLQAMIEADKFHGPSVILAYLPYFNENTPALEVLKETKQAVDAGYWPLYRWDPAKEREGKEPFTLDSDSVKNDLKQFLDRQNHLSQLVLSKPQIATELVNNLGDSLKEARKERARKSYEELLTNINAPPLLVLYGSDGGAAEKIAKRLAIRAKARGLATSVMTMDSISLDSLKSEEHVAFITSTAGQGEPPQNARKLFKSLNAAAASGDAQLTNLRFTVFGMGDSHYWPRPEDAHYYNKPGKDIDSRLEQLGATRIAELGLGDDQDADGPEAGYKLWEPLLWKSLGVDSIEVKEAEPEPITNEHIKAASQYLRGTIAEGLQDTSTGALSPSDGQLTKFHGIYQQDDRDIRDERQAQGVEPAYSFMIRVRLPGGVCLPKQWLQMDQIADEHGSGTFKITTRQTFQFHGVIKRHLKPSIQAINRALLDTLAACGDVNRNVTVSSIPSLSKLHVQAYKFANAVSEHLLPRTTAYHEIWLDKTLVAGDALKDFEPLYGEFYLPRKFKIAVAVPPTNDVDVFTNDVGFIAIVDSQGELSGFNVSIGGGMGVTHGNKKTYPRLGDVIGFCTVDQGCEIAEKIMLVQKDHGNRTDRKNARLKYTIDRMGLAAFKAEVERRLGYSLLPARKYRFDRNVDDFGWATGEDGKHHFTMFIENGRVQDEPGSNFKTGLREVAKIHKGTFRLTANQHLILSEVTTEDLPAIKKLLAEYKLDNLSQGGLRLSSSACVAFPTCGLAMAESERYLPLLINKVETICEENGLRNDSIIMRMTGCPNGCARPYVAEVAFVGKAPGTYSMLLGGGYYGQRLNKIYRETVTEPEILAILTPMIKRYAQERIEGEHFGDFVIRAGYIAPTISGKSWYDRMGGEGHHREASLNVN